MGIFNFFSKLIKSKEKNFSFIDAFDEEFSKIAPKGMYSYSISEQIENIQEWVYTALSLISQTVASQRLFIKDKNGENIDDKYVYSVLMSRDVIYGNIYDKIELGTLFLESTGCMAFYTPRASGRIIGIYPIPTQYISMLQNITKLSDLMESTDTIELKISGVSYKIPKEEMLIIYYNSPLIVNKPFSPINQIRFTVSINKSIDEYLSWVFNNKAEPSLVLTTSQELDDRQAEQIKKRWKSEYQGLNKVGGIAVLGNGVTVDKFSFSPKEMEYLASKKQSKEDILGLLRVPSSLCGITDKTGLGRATAETNEYVFYKYRIVPILNKISTAFSMHFYPKGDKKITYGDIIPPDKEYALKKEEMYIKYGIILPNEIRKEMGREATPYGDVPPEIYNRLSKVDNIENSIKKEEVPFANIKNKGVIFNRSIIGDIQEVRRKKFNRDEKERSEIEKKAEIKYIRVLVEIEKMLLAQIRKNASLIEAIKAGYIIISDKVISEKISPILTDIMEESVRLGILNFENDITKKSLLEIPTDSIVLEYMEEYFGRHLNFISTSLKERILLSIEEGLSKLESEQQLADRVRRLMNIEMSRAKTIIRTETSMAYNFSYNSGLATLGMSRIWVSSLDEFVRQWHLEADGQVVGPNDRYFVMGEYLMYPADPQGSLSNIINCRCQEFAYYNK